MTGTELIGLVACFYLREKIENLGEEEKPARFLADNLTARQTAAFARSILEAPWLASQVEIRLPVGFVGGEGLPEEVLSENPATFLRNSDCLLPARLIANTGDEEEMSLEGVSPIGTAQLQSRPDLWVRAACGELPLSEEHRKWWEKALAAVFDLRTVSLDRLAEYVLRVRCAVSDDGLPIHLALGNALPALQIPRDTHFFVRLNDKHRKQLAKWKSFYQTAVKKHAPFLIKQHPSSGMLLSESELKGAFAKVKDLIPSEHHETIDTFIESPSGWNTAAAALAECEWEDVKSIFDGLRREKFNIGKATLDFFDELDPTLVTEEERNYLKRLAEAKTKTGEQEEDERFYDSHRNELRKDRKLKSAWDKFVFGGARETTDFISGLVLSLEALFNQQEEAEVVSRRLTIRCDTTSKQLLREDLNVEAGRYFAARYSGIKTLFGPKVEWEVGPLLEFNSLVEEWKKEKKKLNYSASKNALQLKFLVSLKAEFSSGGDETYSTQLIWRFDPKAVTSEFREDWERLKEHPLVYSRVGRRSINSKGAPETLNLGDARTFEPAYGGKNGSFIPSYRKTNDAAVEWIANLRSACDGGFLQAELKEEIEGAFKNFVEAYESAVNGFSTQGLSYPALFSQAGRYADFLELLCRKAPGDRNRELLLKPIMRLGTVLIEGGKPAAIIPPWHPLRLFAMAVKARLAADLVKRLLSAEQITFGDPRLFFNDLREQFEHPFYPEVVLGWNEYKPELLSLTDVVGDYSLHESPVAAAVSFDDTNENPTEAANRVVELVKRYLELQPHEQANLSVVLYNCDSAELPQAVVDKVATLYEDGDELRCQVILRHRDGKKLRNLYEKIIETTDTNPDSFNASEATKDFMARLRIGIMADHTSVPDSKEGRPTDIVFSQDVIARQARVEWYQESGNTVAAEKLVPPRWSRRRAAAGDDMKSVVYLCCPVQCPESSTYLTALTSFFRGDWNGNAQVRFLPARQLDFQDPTTRKIFEDTHNLGAWVVNFDELLDRKQLLNQKVRVIRYKQSTTQGRNLVISSNAPLGLLRSVVLNRLRDLDLGIPDDGLKKLADRFINDANDVSGDIVLRAAKRGRNASELLGIVLSRFLVRHEIGKNKLFGWFFLDDYASWLGQREEQIADILALSPEIQPDGIFRLSVILTEAKYIQLSNLSVKRKESEKQLRDTVVRVLGGLLINPQRLDRDSWLARLSDLLLGGVQIPAGSKVSLSDWRMAVREGRCEILIRGYSHVFISTPDDGHDPSAFFPLPDLEDCWQEVFGRERLRRLVLLYEKDEDPSSFRAENGGPAWRRQHFSSLNQSVSIVPLSSPEEGESHIDLDPKSGPSPEMNRLNVSAESPSPRQTNSKWAYPQIQEILPTIEATFDTPQDAAWLRQTENRVRTALQQFHLQSKLLTSCLTPNSALLKFAGSANLTIDQVLKRQSEFLTTYGLNIVSVRPEPGIVSLAVERPHRKTVLLPQVWPAWQPESTFGNQRLLVGIREEDGKLLMLSPGLHHAPHTLIAGATGSGKSVLMQNILMAIAATNNPSQAEIVLIDPKQGVDYFLFEGLPHLKQGIIVDQENAVAILDLLTEEMDSRFEKFRSARASNLAAYNLRVRKEQRLPAIWLIHDEFAEWMLIEEYKKTVVSCISRLGVKARAAGIYLVFAAQRPDAHVMPMQLRANLGNRLILRVDSEGTSEIALGERGAEKLLGKGHLIAKLEGESSLVLAQVPFIPEEFLEQFVEIISSASIGSSMDK